MAVVSTTPHEHHEYTKEEERREKNLSSIGVIQETTVYHEIAIEEEILTQDSIQKDDVIYDAMKEDEAITYEIVTTTTTL